MSSCYRFGPWEYELPDRWTNTDVEDASGLLEIENPQRTGALHITFLKRNSLRPATERDAIELIEKFAESTGFEASGRIEPSRDGAVFRAKCLCVKVDASDGFDRYWLLYSYVSGRRAYMASFNSVEIDENTIKLVSTIMSSVRLRRWWLRWV